jgi:phage anti-repressor protein
VDSLVPEVTLETNLVVVSPESVLAGDPAEQFPVDARRLHAWLEVGRDYTNWIKCRIEEFGFVEKTDFTSFLAKSRGRPLAEFRLTIDMAKELAMVERSAKGREIRRYFIACESELKRHSATLKPWQLARDESKIVRRIETDVIKAFIEYAKGQGSESAEKYYLNFSKMVNAALLELDGTSSPTPLRDRLNAVQLHSISVAENVIAKVLVECMAKQLPYKSIYQMAKERISALAAAIGKSKPGITIRQQAGLIA